PTIAKGVEARLREIGHDLFDQIFDSSSEGRKCWTHAQMSLPELRVEIVADVTASTDIPWELMREQASNTTLALSAREFVRSQRGTQPAFVAQQQPSQVRILLVIARPAGRHDVPFRSVASRLVKRLGADAADSYRLDVLRPPSFESLGKALRKAA